MSTTTTDAATIEAVEALPTVQDDATVKRLVQSLDDLAKEEKQTGAALQTARAEVQAATDALEDLEIEQYASEDVTAEDVDAARERLASEQRDVKRLEVKADRIEKAITRVQDRLKTEREEKAGRRVYEEYAPVVLATSKRAAAALSEAMDALEAMNAARAKAKANKVRPTSDYEKPSLSLPFDALRNRNSKTMGAALRAALQTAEAPVEDLEAYV